MAILIPPSRACLDEAFRLAFFLHPYKDVALDLLTRALVDLDVAVQRQDKRAYYSLRGRRDAGPAFRRYVSLGTAPLLQRLIYAESERVEREREAGLSGGRCSGEDLVVYYLKHLARITIRRSSFYVALGIGRLLHEYTTAETMEIFGLVIQDADRVKDECYWRSRKRVLMAEMKERFEERLRASRNERGEDRFAPVEDSRPWLRLVQEALCAFTPWGTSCSLPATFDPRWDLLPTFASAGPEREDEREIERIHALLHPSCYETLTRFLGFDPTLERLRVPRFWMSDSSGDGEGSAGPHASRRAPPLAPEERAEIAAFRARLATERRSLVPRSLRMVVDDREAGQIDLAPRKTLGVDVPAGAEWLKVYGSDGSGECLLAVLNITLKEPTEGAPSALERRLKLPGGWQLALAVAPRGEAGPHRLSIRCERAGARALLGRLWDGVRPPVAPRSAWALASTLAAVAVGAVLGRLPAPAPPSGPPGASPAPPEASDTRPRPPESPAATAFVAPPALPSPDGERTRAVQPRAPALPVDGPRRLYLQVDGTWGPQVREALAEALRATRKVSVVGSPEEADAALKVQLVLQGDPLRPFERTRMRVRVQMVDPEGTVLWPGEGAPFADSGSLQDVLRRLVARLADEL